MSRLQQVVKRLGHKPWFASVNKHIAPRVDRVVHRLSRGRATMVDTFLVPTLMLTHTGRKSGKTYQTPLSYVRDGDGFVLAATNWGQRHHPAWSANLLANAEATVSVDGREIAVRARRITDDAEKARVWSKLVEIWPAYDTYVDRSGRDIRVFMLEPR